MGATVLILGFAWYQKLKPYSKEDIECACVEDNSAGKAGESSFWQSKKFLGVVTALAVILIAFPYYSGAFFPEKNAVKTVIVKESDLVDATLIIKGMSCTGCEQSVKAALTLKEGVVEALSSYETGTATIKFDRRKVSIDELADAVEKETGYKVTHTVKRSSHERSIP